MKVIYLLTILLLTVFLSSCTTENAKQEAQHQTRGDIREEKEVQGATKEPEQIGRIVFDILKNLSTESKQEYAKHFASIEDIRKLGRNETVITDQKFRNKMTSLPKEEWEQAILKNYNRTKEKAASLGISWQEITYLDFVYEIETKESIKALEGKLYFKSNDKSYNIKVGSIWNGTEYLIFQIGDLSAR